MDDHYWSEAEIQVLYGAGSPIGSQNSDRAAILVRERMTTNSLERIIVDNGLYPQERRSGLLAKAVEAMQKDISTSVVRDDVVRLAFRASDPGLAQRVTGQLAVSDCKTLRVRGPFRKIVFCRACQMQSRTQRQIWRNKKKRLRISTFASWEVIWKNRRQLWPRSIDSSCNCSRTPTCSMRCKSRNHLRRGFSFSNRHLNQAVGLQTPNFKVPRQLQIL